MSTQLKVRQFLKQFHRNYRHCADFLLSSLFVIDIGIHDLLGILDDQLRQHGMDIKLGIAYIVCYPSFVCIGFILISLLLLRYLPIDFSNDKSDQNAKTDN